MRCQHSSTIHQAMDTTIDCEARSTLLRVSRTHTRRVLLSTAAYGLALSLGAANASGQAVTTGGATPPIDGPAASAFDGRLVANASGQAGDSVQEEGDYGVGPDDLLTIAVVQAPELNVTVRVARNGEITVPLLGPLRTTGLTIRQLEGHIADLLRAKYIRQPDVSVQLTELHSRPVAVMGAVQQPGVFQIRGRQSLLQVLSLAGGLAPHAGDTIIIVRDENTSGPTDPLRTARPIIQVPLADLMEARGAALDVTIYPGDVVKVQSAALVYVVGAVKKPGSFAVRGSRGVTVLRAVALAEGLGPTAKHDVRILRSTASGDRTELAVDLDAIFKGKKQDMVLQAEDVLFVPTSGGRVIALATVDALARVVSFRGVIP